MIKATENLKINLNTPKIESNNKPNLTLSNEITKTERRNSVFIPHPQIFFDASGPILQKIFNYSFLIYILSHALSIFLNPGIPSFKYKI